MVERFLPFSLAVCVCVVWSLVSKDCPQAIFIPSQSTGPTLAILIIFPGYSMLYRIPFCEYLANLPIVANGWIPVVSKDSERSELRREVNILPLESSSDNESSVGVEVIVIIIFRIWTLAKLEGCLGIADSAISKIKRTDSYSARGSTVGWPTWRCRLKNVWRWLKWGVESRGRRGVAFYNRVLMKVQV